ncbi:hypothetical protein HPB49_019530 [Dermacentor silvarum]|uniref:Uncharacterized protein n=1 Tax=Dermacentor silvarum TaxID=543639 RepID=A0ACB8CZE5_DERSI|nr:hypothetical protein HPB49_019530 [Dermacentor silvarum]
MVLKDIATSIDYLATSSINHQIVTILPQKHSKARTITTNVYSPPKEKRADVEALIRYVKAHSSTQDRLLLLGDFNAPHTSWGYRTDTPKGRELEQAVEAYDFQLIILPQNPTRLGNSVSADTFPDLTFTNNVDEVFWTNLEENLGSDHFILSVSVGSPKIRRACGHVVITDWGKRQRHSPLRRQDGSGLGDAGTSVGKGMRHSLPTLQSRWAALEPTAKAMGTLFSASSPGCRWHDFRLGQAEQVAAVFALVYVALEVHFSPLEERHARQQAVAAGLVLRPDSFNLQVLGQSLQTSSQVPAVLHEALEVVDGLEVYFQELEAADLARRQVVTRRQLQLVSEVIAVVKSKPCDLVGQDHPRRHNNLGEFVRVDAFVVRLAELYARVHQQVD